MISEWALDPFGEGWGYAGIRYKSRLGDWECWAIRDDAIIDIDETHSITLHIPQLQSVAKQWNLRVF
jgi:hypothetical protein